MIAYLLQQRQRTMKNFDIAKYLKENQLGSYGILNPYVDLKPLKEEEKETELDTVVPYEGPDHKLTGMGDKDEFKQAEIVSEYESDDYFVDTDRMMDLGGNQIERGIVGLLDDGFEAEDVLSLCKEFIDAHAGARAQGKRF